MSLLKNKLRGALTGEKNAAASDFNRETAQDVAKAHKGKSFALALLGVSICCEVIGTIALKESYGFTVPVPSVITIAAYAVSFSLLIYILQHLPLGLVYGIWGGVGTAVTMFVGVIIWHDPFTPLMAAAVVLIVGGVYLLNKGTDEIEAKRAQEEK